MNAMTLTDATFEQDVLKSEVPVMVDFWAEWCQPCKMVSPLIDELAQEYEGKLKVGKMNVDENVEREIINLSKGIIALRDDLEILKKNLP